MGAPKIDLRQLDSLVRAGRSTTAIAKEFNVTAGAISQAKRRLKHYAVRVVGLERAGAVVQDHIDMKGQLAKVNLIINEQIEKTVLEIERADGVDARLLRETLSKLVGEVRKQIETQLAVFSAWHDVQEYGLFQKDVLQVIGEFSHEAKSKLEQRLRERALLRGFVKLD
jgi:hypothetical protein